MVMRYSKVFNEDEYYIIHLSKVRVEIVLDPLLSNRSANLIQLIYE